MPKKATLKAATKERDAERSKQALLEAAQRLFSGRGYTEVSVRDIAADAGINPALVSYYFGSKKALFAMALDVLMHTEYFASLDRDRFGAELVDRISRASRSEEHTSELQSLMRITYGVFCLKKKKYHTQLQQ